MRARGARSITIIGAGIVEMVTSVYVQMNGHRTHIMEMHDNHRGHLGGHWLQENGEGAVQSRWEARERTLRQQRKPLVLTVLVSVWGDLIAFPG